ncbi:3-isopropylmalate dehydratase small subunit [Sesamum alatum]|uniref:3-isopropylmalate dehydratase n=1 Tax=Sesamum alatum TaxID=300844 RepID=A0AAE1YQX0_9LAMI|nr:3-isopropylmalate dehydratase small subunit [Sesamum alatum]
MAAAAAAAFPASSTFNHSSTTQNPSVPSLSSLSFSRKPVSSVSCPIRSLESLKLNRCARFLSAAAPSAASSTASAATTFHGLCYVVGDNIDTDQIIPAEYLTLVPSNPDEYEKLGSYALIGLPASYQSRFVEPGATKTKYSIVIGGDNFGCGSSREHAPVALGASGVAAVVAESYARIFFRNSVATGEVYPLESEGRLCEECSTGDVVTIELGEDSKLINHTTGKEYKLKPIGDAGPVIEAGGIFAYARKAGMIPSRDA